MLCGQIFASVASRSAPSLGFARLHQPFGSARRTLFVSSPVMASEVDAAKRAAAEGAAVRHAPTIFDKIVAKEIPADVIYEDDLCMAFRDASPQAPVHFLVIPKSSKNLTQLRTSTEDEVPLMGHLMMVAGRLGSQECPRGFRVVVNDGEHGSQSVYHLHLHVLGGRQLTWPPG